jgi:hypothetical protein
VAQWREERDRAVAARGAALAAQREAEARRARELIARFVAQAHALGLPGERLSCRSQDGKARYRTRLFGWYLTRARTIAVDVAGNYYTLTVPRSVMARFRGADPQPQEPRLIVGEGARDGESMPLQELLSRRLERG